MELPHRHSGVEDGAGAGLRQCGGVQARRPRAGFGLGAVRDHLAFGHSEGRVQPRHGPRLGRRPDDAGLSGRERHLVHGLGRDRRQGCHGLRLARRQVPAGDGRQEPARRSRRRKPRSRVNISLSLMIC